MNFQEPIIHSKVLSKWEELKSKSADINYFLSSLDKRPDIKVGVFGGAVRDWWLGFEPNDIDIVIENDNDQIIENLLQNFGARKNIFGGNVLNINGTKFDFWALEDTYALKFEEFPTSWDGLVKSVPFDTDSIVVLL